MSDREPKCPGHPCGLMRVNTATGETTCNTCGGYMFTARLAALEAAVDAARARCKEGDR